MILFPNAKINIGLNVVSQRSDGYHNLETIFYPVADLCDTLEIEESKGGTTLEIKGIKIDGDVNDNLVMKAYRLLAADFHLPPVKIVLDKKIPFGAGLGGGSADAAFTLKGLNEMFSLGLDNRKLEDYAVRLGADCPFFIENKPVYATGIGNIFEDVELDLSGYKISIEKPDVFVSTATAYRGVKPKPSSFDLRKIGQLPVNEWRNVIKNDFEESVFPQFPEIEKLKNSMYERGAVYASMSGSGSAVFSVQLTVNS